MMLNFKGRAARSGDTDIRTKARGAAWPPRLIRVWHPREGDGRSLGCGWVLAGAGTVQASGTGRRSAT